MKNTSNKEINYDREIKEIIEERQKWKCFFEILKRRYIYIPAVVALIYVIDNPDINIIGYVIKFAKAIAGFN